MKLCGKIAAVMLKSLLHVICKVDDKELEKIPLKGPFIIAMNHISFLEVPLFYVDLAPRKVHGIAKKETWKNLITRILANCWDSISIDREGFTASTFRKVRNFLNQDRIIVIAPEGTRTGDGKLIKAHPGIISMAMLSDVPIIPVVHFGAESFWKNIARFKRTPFTYRVGKPLRITTSEKNSRIRQELVDQLMLRLAELLPPQYRGYYSDLNEIDTEYFEEL
jgi:1-acyl-sn-glycerol-3-phosphate acyltransferase